MTGNLLHPQPKEWLKGNVIGSGSHGSVHLAIDSTTGALFVSKSAKSKYGIMSLKNESEFLENLQSPHIVTYYGKDSEENGEYSLFFEYMAGGSLSDLANKFGGSLDEKLIRLYTREILHGLKYLHENGIVHSDLKCKNVLLGSLGNVKLADFGCARRIMSINSRTTDTSSDNNTSNSIIGGTPLWMSPEVLRQEQIDFSADIWSLGCTVIEMATGKPPWNCNETMMPTILEIAKEIHIPRFPQNFSREGLDFLAKCLIRDPRKRWMSEELLDHPFVTLEEVCLKNDYAFSPTSVLNDFAVYDDSDDDEFMNKNDCHSEESSDSCWITVRSS